MDIQQQIFQLFSNPKTTLSLYLAIELNIIKNLSVPKLTAELLEIISIPLEKLQSLLEILSSLRILSIDEQNQWANTLLSSLFINENLQNITRQVINPLNYEFEACLEDLLSNSITLINQKYGISMHEEFIKIPDHISALFNAGKEASTLYPQPLQFSAIDLSSCRRVLSIGGGNSNTLIHLCFLNPHISGTIFDDESQCDAAQINIQKSNLREKIDTMNGTFLEPFPEDYDCIIIENFLKNSERICKKILGNCRMSLNPGDLLKIIDYVIVESSPLWDFTKSLKLDISALGLKEITQQHVENYLYEAGFRFDRIISIGENFLINATAI